MRQITATEAARRFSEVLDAVEHTGESFVITRGGRVVASLAPPPVMPARALKELIGRRHPDPAWARDIDEVRRLLTPPGRSWPD